MKEAYRLQKNSLSKKLYDNKKFMTLFIIYSGNVLPEYKDVSEKIFATLNKLEKIADESAGSNT